MTARLAPLLVLLAGCQPPPQPTQSPAAEEPTPPPDVVQPPPPAPPPPPAADEPEEPRPEPRAGDLFTRKLPPDHLVDRFWVNPSCPYPVMLAAPILRLFHRAVDDAVRAGLTEPAHRMDECRRSGGIHLARWDYGCGWMLDYGPFDPFGWGLYCYFWAGRTAIIWEWQARVDREFARFEKFRDAPTWAPLSKWAPTMLPWDLTIPTPAMRRSWVSFLDGVYACVDYSDWAHTRVPSNRLAWAAWAAEREAKGRRVESPNLYGPRPASVQR